MKYEELRQLYSFAVDNKINITKHDVVIPSKDDIEELVQAFEIDTDVKKTIQVLEGSKYVSFMMSIGTYGAQLTLFETLTQPSDEYTVNRYIEELEEEF